MIIPAEQQRYLDTIPGDREMLERAWRYGVLYGRYQAMQAALGAVHDLPSPFGLPDGPAAAGDPGEVGQAIAELQGEVR